MEHLLLGDDDGEYFAGSCSPAKASGLFLDRGLLIAWVDRAVLSYVGRSEEKMVAQWKSMEFTSITSDRSRIATGSGPRAFNISKIGCSIFIPTGRIGRKGQSESPQPGRTSGGSAVDVEKFLDPDVVWLESREASSRASARGAVGHGRSGTGRCSEWSRQPWPLRQDIALSHPKALVRQTMVITRTPLRISFFGGGTDYPVWYREHGGAVLCDDDRQVLLYHLPMAAAVFRLSQPGFVLQG